jgi:hypothetical protein
MSILPSRLGDSEGGYSWYPASYDDIENTNWRGLFDRNSDQQFFLIKNSIDEVLGCVICLQAPQNLLLANTFLDSKANSDKVVEVLKLLFIDYYGSKYEEERISNKYMVHQIEERSPLCNILQQVGFKRVEDRYRLPLGNILNCSAGRDFLYHTLNGCSSFELEGVDRIEENSSFLNTINRNVQSAIIYVPI